LLYHGTEQISGFTNNKRVKLRYTVMKVALYTPRITARVSYTFDTILKEILGLTVEYFDDEQAFIKSGIIAKMSYAPKAIDKELHFTSYELLFEKGIWGQDISMQEWNNSFAFFQVENDELPYDLFACTFYLISRYEEYLASNFDEHDRFCAHQSLTFQHKILKRALVNEWAEIIKQLIKKHYSFLECSEKTNSFLSTVDVDSAFAFAEKDWVETAGGYVSSLIKADTNSIRKRYNVLKGKEKDPHYTFDHLEYIHKKFNIKPIYFFLMQENKGILHHNKNVGKAFERLIKRLAEYADIALHPSYLSFSEADKLEMEKYDLEQITGKTITQSRQHYIRLSFPETYRNLLKNGIVEDYSMGYHDEPGFRAGIASPFYFYDILKEAKTELKVFPFCQLESAYKYYKKQSPKSFLVDQLILIDALKKSGGMYCSLFHNDSLGNFKPWKGWSNLYEEHCANLIDFNA
jgi:hypothetical protein